MAKPKLGVWFEGFLYDPTEDKVLDGACEWLVDASEHFRVYVLVNGAGKPMRREAAGGKLYAAGLTRDCIELDRITTPERDDAAIFTGDFAEESIMFPKHIPDVHVIVGAHCFAWAPGEDRPSPKALEEWHIWYKEEPKEE